VSILQAWLFVGLPGLIVAGALFYGRSRTRSLLGYLVLLAAFIVMAYVDRASAAVIGGLTALLYAAGRGGIADAAPENTSTIGVPDEVRRPVRQKVT
jgi:hypothetical protein